ncbi:MAG: neutral zinc metallopeptidase, partial [Chitinophagaceae bacterium]
MLWKGGRQSGNVDDRRGVSGGQIAVGGGILGVIALVLNFLIGGDVDTSQLPQIPGIQNNSPSSPELQ